VFEDVFLDMMNSLVDVVEAGIRGNKKAQGTLGVSNALRA
jgi:hypothetical protein